MLQKKLNVSKYCFYVFLIYCGSHPKGSRDKITHYNCPNAKCRCYYIVEVIFKTIPRVPLPMLKLSCFGLDA